MLDIKRTSLTPLTHEDADNTNYGPHSAGGSPGYPHFSVSGLPREIYPSATNRSRYWPRLIYNRVPKCASSTMQVMMLEDFFFKKVLRTFDITDCS